MLTILLLQASLLGEHLQLTQAPPEVRAARHLLLMHAGEAGLPGAGLRSLEEALELALHLRERALGRGDFADCIAAYSEAPTRAHGGELGSHPRGVLEPELDTFLFAAQLGEISVPIATAQTVQLVQRVEAEAGVLQILVAGSDAAAAQEAEKLYQQLRAGADFGALARAHSADPTSGAAGGAYAIFERGANDTLLKRAIFRAAPDTLLEPIATPLGWHILRRVDPASLSPALRESRWVRLRLLLLTHAESQGVPAPQGRTREAAAALAAELRAALAAGEDFAAIARRYNDDPGGRERAGDIGWLHRATPGRPPWLQRAWLEPVGYLSEVISTPAGFILFRREY